VCVCAACESRGGAGAEAVEHCSEGVSCNEEGRDVRGEGGGRIFVRVKGSKLLHDFRGDSGKVEGLQAACGTTNITGLQQRVHAGGQSAIRGGKRVTSLSEGPIRARAAGRGQLKCGCFGLQRTPVASK
jgi:hypothetical protein